MIGKWVIKANCCCHMKKAGVPTIPGSDGISYTLSKKAKRVALNIGFPSYIEGHGRWGWEGLCEYVGNEIELKKEVGKD